MRAAFDDVPVNRAVATVLEVLTTGERADLIIDQLVEFGRSELAKNRVTIRVRIHEQSPWWLPKFVDQEIFDKLVGGLEELLDAIAADPKHPARRDQGAPRRAAARDGRRSRAGREEPRAEGRARRTPGRPRLRVRALAAAAHRARGGAGGRDLAACAGAQREIGALGARLRADAALASELDDWLKQLLLRVVDNYRDPLCEIVSETIESWDAQATSRRIELNIGTDLQFIRVNGTLVGGLVGLALYLGGLAFG